VYNRYIFAVKDMPMRWMIWPCLLALALMLTGCGKRTAVTISPKAATIQPGDSAWFTAAVTGPRNTAVSWSLAEQGSGEIFQGLYNAPKRAGTFHLIAASTADPKTVAAATITVSPMPVILQPIMVTLPLKGHSPKPVQFTATAIDETGEHLTDVTWRVLEKGGGSISAKGVYTPPAKAGTYHVEAVSKVNTKATAIAGIYIMQ